MNADMFPLHAVPSLCFQQLRSSDAIAFHVGCRAASAETDADDSDSACAPNHGYRTDADWSRRMRSEQRRDGFDLFGITQHRLYSSQHQIIVALSYSIIRLEAICCDM